MIDEVCPECHGGPAPCGCLTCGGRGTIWKSEPDPVDPCDHGVTFDPETAKGMDSYEVRRRWPRLSGLCPKGCGYRGASYQSYLHYLSGDW